MDIFQKCRDYTLADEVKKQGLYPYFHAFEENEGPVVVIEDRKIIMAGSNNYLGLTTHPRVREAAKKAIDKYGTGCSGSRYLTGSVTLHFELEERLAKFMGKEACMTYSTGFQTALGVISTLVQHDEYVISDRDNHACIVMGTFISKGQTAELVRYKHNDMDHLETVISKIPLDAPKLIVSDGVFSTSGDILDLPRMVEVAKKYNARVMIDDAHSVGVIGKGGRGTASYFGLDGDVDLTMGTFSKTFASLGGFVVGERAVINYLQHHSAAFIFSASPTPASVAAAIEALKILEEQPELVDKLISNADYVRQGLKKLGFKVHENKTAIVPVIIGDTMKTLLFWRKLFDAGVYANAFVRPGVPPGMEMLRTSYMATHERHHLDKIVELFGEIGRELGVIA
ncbi:MAG TPA: aminotransferase class I/II-fold pyridoxal phosphate-dependent enzyme [Candidatus Acidoferrales bacterium]|nr:aminotransferase class I/II-fold pyridoxal phosphate-dependent enzyme [Candidatus Acidoferrales bacterium]